jgi:hypothetical protein
VTIEDIVTIWQYSYSPNAATPSQAYYTVYVATTDEQRRRGRPIIAQTSLSYLTCLSSWGAGALISSYTPPFGPPPVTTDFKDNSLRVSQAIAVTFQLSAFAAEAYAAGTVYLLK